MYVWGSEGLFNQQHIPRTKHRTNVKRIREGFSILKSRHLRFIP